MMSAITARENEIRPAAATGIKRPRVLHLLNYFEAGGTERQAVELLKRIDQQKYDVRLAVLRNHGPLYSEIADLFPSIPEFTFSSFYDATALKQLIRLRSMLRREKIDILHAHDFYAGMIGVVASRLAGVKVIASQRNLKFSDRRSHIWGQRLINRLADRLLVNSDAIREHLVAGRAVASEKIVVIKNGLREPDIRPSQNDVASIRRELCRELGISDTAKLVGIVANLRPVKGHGFLIDAASRVVGRLPNTHFILVGDGELRPQLEEQARGLGIADNIHLLGFRPDAAGLQAAFDLAVLASLHEGLPNSVMEAMAAGVPVVSTAVGGVRELIEDGVTGYLTPPGDSSALAQTLIRAIENHAETGEIAARGRRFITSTFSMQSMLAKVENLYDQLNEFR